MSGISNGLQPTILYHHAIGSLQICISEVDVLLLEHRERYTLLELVDVASVDWLGHPYQRYAIFGNNLYINPPFIELATAAQHIP